MPLVLNLTLFLLHMSIREDGLTLDEEGLKRSSAPSSLNLWVESL